MGKIGWLVVLTLGGCGQPSTLPDRGLEPAAAPPADPTAALFDEKDIDRPAQPIYFAKPTYPKEFQREGICGSAEVTYIIGTNGLPEQSTIAVLAATRPPFGVEAVEAIRRSRFTAPVRQGQLVRERVTQRITFRVGAVVGASGPAPC